MAHLACIKHKRRAMVLPTSVIHRSSGEPCDGITFSFGEKRFTVGAVRAYSSKLSTLGLDQTIDNQSTNAGESP